MLALHGLYLVDAYEPELFALAVIYRVPALAAAVLHANECSYENGRSCVLDEMPWESVRQLHPAIFYGLFLSMTRGALAGGTSALTCGS